MHIIPGCVVVNIFYQTLELFVVILCFFEVYCGIHLKSSRDLL